MDLMPVALKSFGIVKKSVKEEGLSVKQNKKLAV